MTADNVRCFAVAMNQPAAPLFAAAYDHYLCFIKVGKFFRINGNGSAKLPFLVGFIMRYLTQVHRVEEVGNI